IHSCRRLTDSSWRLPISAWIAARSALLSAAALEPTTKTQVASVAATIIGFIIFFRDKIFLRWVATSTWLSRAIEQNKLERRISIACNAVEGRTVQQLAFKPLPLDGGGVGERVTPTQSAASPPPPLP